MTLLMSFLLLLAPIKVEQGRFNILKDGRRIGTEDFAITMRGMHWVIEGKANIGDVSMSSKMELNEKLQPVSYEVSSTQGRLRVNVNSPASELETIVNGETSSTDFRFPEDGIILDNNLFHHYLISMYRVQTGQTNFGVFVPQDMSVGSATVRSTGPRTYDLEIGDVKMQATTNPEGGLIKLVVPMAKVSVER